MGEKNGSTPQTDPQIQHDPIKSSFLCRILQGILKFIWNIKETWRAKTILKKENNVGALILLLPNFKTSYKTTVIKTVLRGLDTQTNGIELRAQEKTFTHIYNQLNFG